MMFIRLYRSVFPFFPTAHAFFLVYLTPLSLPLVIYTIITHQVRLVDILTFVIFFVVTGLGLTLGYHRLVAHRSYEARPWLKVLLLSLGAFALQGPPAAWASLHIQHHSFADEFADPHSPQKGFWHAHCGWLFNGFRPNFHRYGKHLLKDKIVNRISRGYIFFTFLSLFVPFLLGGTVGFIWSGLFRLFLTSHVTWSVNSWCHRSQGGHGNFIQTLNYSRNNWYIALISFGEGWHQNHHHAPQSAYLGWKWYQIDIGKYFLIFFQKLGWIKKVKFPPT